MVDAMTTSSWPMLSGGRANHDLIVCSLASHSCLMQDEPERGYGFSRKVRLKGVGIGMLGIDHQHGRYRSGESGADPGVFGGERGGSIRRGAAWRGLRVGD